MVGIYFFYVNTDSSAVSTLKIVHFNSMFATNFDSGEDTSTCTVNLPTFAAYIHLDTYSNQTLNKPDLSTQSKW
jgi:hypothetical protein